MSWRVCPMSGIFHAIARRFRADKFLGIIVACDDVKPLAPALAWTLPPMPPLDHVAIRIVGKLVDDQRGRDGAHGEDHPFIGHFLPFAFAGSHRNRSSMWQPSAIAMRHSVAAWSL